MKLLLTSLLCPASIFEISRILLINNSKLLPAVLMIESVCLSSFLILELCCNSSEKPKIAFIGVRISCDILAKKFVLAELAISAVSLALTSSSVRSLTRCSNSKLVLRRLSASSFSVSAFSLRIILIFSAIARDSNII